MTLSGSLLVAAIIPFLSATGAVVVGMARRRRHPDDCRVSALISAGSHMMTAHLALWFAAVLLSRIGWLWSPVLGTALLLMVLGTASFFLLLKPDWGLRLMGLAANLEAELDAAHFGAYEAGGLWGLRLLGGWYFLIEVYVLFLVFPIAALNS